MDSLKLILISLLLSLALLVFMPVAYGQDMPYWVEVYDESAEYMVAHE